MNSIPLLPKFDQLKIYIKPHIPRNKIKNALENYVYCYNSDIDEDDVLLLIDETTSGSAKDGILFTSKQFFYHTGHKGYRSISDIKSIQIKAGFFSSRISFQDRVAEDEWWDINLNCSKDDLI